MFLLQTQERKGLVAKLKARVGLQLRVHMMTWWGGVGGGGCCLACMTRGKVMTGRACLSVTWREGSVGEAWLEGASKL